MGVRRFDGYVAVAFRRVMEAYLKNLLDLRREHPHYIFRLDNINFGRYVTASAMRDARTNISRLRFFTRFAVAMARSIFVYAAALRLEGRVSGIFLGDIYYLDGIWIEFYLSKPGVTVYAELDPLGLIFTSSEFGSLEEFHTYAMSQLAPEGDEKSAELMMDRRTADPYGAIFYYHARSDGSLPIPNGDDRPLALIYAHSFTDAQLAFGFDGFKNVFDWLVFTVDELVALTPAVRVVVKSHPNFFSTDESGTQAMDKKVWDEFCRRYAKEVELINHPVDNYKILSNLNPMSTVLFSHHGNALVEGAYMGFQSVSSVSSTWGLKYTFSNVWSSRQQYQKLISEVFSVLATSESKRASAVRYAQEVYLSSSAPGGDDYYLAVIAAHLGVSQKELVKSPNRFYGHFAATNQAIVEALTRSFRSF
jgi:hypothetical protein